MKAMRLDEIMRRLRCSTLRKATVFELKQGVMVRFANASIETRISAAEASELLSLRMIRKLKVLCDAANSSTQWVDAWMEPPICFWNLIVHKIGGGS